MGKLSRENIQALVARGELNFDNENLTDLDLSGLNLEGATFKDADLRGTTFFDSDYPERRTNLRGTVWTNANFPDQNNTNKVGVPFGEADLTGAVFDATGPNLLNLSTLDFGGANLANTKWTGAFFGEMDYYNPLFDGTTLRGAVFAESDLSGLDLSQAGSTTGIRIIDPLSLRQMRIRGDQLETVLQGLEVSDASKKAELESTKQEIAVLETEEDKIAMVAEKLGIEIIRD